MTVDTRTSERVQHASDDTNDLSEGEDTLAALAKSASRLATSDHNLTIAAQNLPVRSQ